MSGTRRMMSSPASAGAESLASPCTQLTAFTPMQVDIGSQRVREGPFARVADFRPSDPFAGYDSILRAAQLSDATASLQEPPAGFDCISGSPMPFGTGAACEVGFVTQSLGLGGREGLVDPTSSAFRPAGNGQGVKRTVDARVMERPLFTEGRHRRFAVENVRNDLESWMIVQIFHDFPTVEGPSLAELSTKGRFSVAFADSRDAGKAMERVRRIHPEWRLVPVTVTELAKIVDPTSSPTSSDFEGQVLVTVYPESGTRHLHTSEIMILVKPILELVGEVQLFEPREGGPVRMHEFLVEFYNTRHASNAVKGLHCTRSLNMIFEVVPYQPDVVSPASRLRIPAGMVSRSDWSSSGKVARTSRLQVTPAARPLYLDELDDISPTFVEEISASQPCSRPAPQAIDVERIRLGLDVRTTVMLRNIPNKMTSGELKVILDETSFAKYDFMYLRMDFEHRLNVGYAFVNFADPIDIIDLVSVREGRSWPRFSSDKIAEISYATMQGKDCLVNKFRNSSVMLMETDFRPKIFHVGNGHLAGAEAMFPPPNDYNKLRRSVANTNQNGLFGPRSAGFRRFERAERNNIHTPLPMRASFGETQAASDSRLRNSKIE